MKKEPIIIVMFLLFSSTLFAQVGINTDSSDPNSSAMLDVKSISKGFLPPRMTFEQRNAIPNPVEGLMVYCSNCNADGTGGISIFQGAKWKTINLNCYPPDAPESAAFNCGVTYISWQWLTVPIALGYKWNTVNNYNTATDLGATHQVAETGLTCWTAYTRYVWAYNACGNSDAFVMSASTESIPFSLDPPAGTHVSSLTQIVWNWYPVTGATGYKWSSTNNFTTASDMGADHSKTETGLTCNTLYTRYIWAYNACGFSNATTLTKATSSSPVNAPAAGTHVALAGQITWKWFTASGATGYKWNTTNDYATATDMGAGLLKIEAELICNTSYTRYVWGYNTCGISTVTTLTKTTSSNPLSPDPGTNVPSANQIVWNWYSVSGATGYKWNTTNNYGTASDMGTATSKTETGLTNGLTYTRYIWAYNTCGMSASTIISQGLFYIGLNYGGGIVFYIDGTGQHGLIAATTDQSAGAEWGCYGTSVPGTSTAIGTGQANTTAIVNGCSTAGIAARICNSLIWPPSNPHSDWFLPSKDELNQMYIQQSVIGGFASNAYWSSSEYNADYAWAQYFYNGFQSGYSKNATYYVRAVRAF